MPDNDDGRAGEIERFLRACLRLRLDPTQRAAVDAAARGLADDWEAVGVAIESERIGPLLHETVDAIVAPPLAEQLYLSYHATALRNLLLLRELGTCLRALTTAAVPVIVLKGAALIETVYGNLSLRPMGDVDLLVRESDVTVTRRTLDGLGYAAKRIETHPGALTEYENEVALCKPGKLDTWVDVHWGLFDSPYYQDRIVMDWFWESARPAPIADVPALVLGPEALLIHLCGHLALHHAHTGLLWWYDVAEALAAHRAEIDWPVLLAHTEEYGLLLPVRAVLSRAVDEWGAAIPAGVLHALRSLRESPMEQRIFADLTAAQRSPRQRFWSDLTSMSDWRQRLRFARMNLFPSPTYMRQRYAIAHPLLIPLYYPYRWLRGALGLG
jgi:hypothetical protein